MVVREVQLVGLVYGIGDCAAVEENDYQDGGEEHDYEFRNWGIHVGDYGIQDLIRHMNFVC